jgi:transposase-like protein
LYSSLISEWRSQRDAGALQGLTDKPAGRPKSDPTRAELAKAQAEVARLRAELDTARELIDAQGKVSALLHDLSRKSADPNTTRS